MIPCRCPRLLLLCILAGTCLVGWAAYSLFTPSTLPPLGLEAATTEIEVPGCVAGQAREVVIPLYNRSGQPLRVLGLAEC